MTVLTDVMNADVGLLLEDFREPAVTAYNRLEARPRAHDFTRSLRAEVRDAMWMLTRQWQMGELEADDAGVADRRASPRAQADASIACSSAPAPRRRTTTACRWRRWSSANACPSRTRCACRPRSTSCGCTRRRCARLICHDISLRVRLRARRRGGVSRSGGRSQPLRRDAPIRRSMARRCWRRSAPARSPPTCTSTPGDLLAMQRITDAFVAWFARQYSQPASGATPAWDDSRLSYSMTTSAPASDGSQVVLAAPRYDEGRLDWSSFEVVPRAPTLPVSDEPHVSPLPLEEAISFCRLRRPSRGCRTRVSGRWKSGR